MSSSNSFNMGHSDILSFGEELACILTNKKSYRFGL